MLKKLFSLLILFTLFLSLPGVVLAGSGNIQVPKDEVISHDFYNAGENVTISGTINGDVFVAGANVLVDGTINGDLIAAGATVTVLGNVSDDVRAAGSSVLIKGRVGKNVTAFGSSVTLGSEGNVAGSLLAAGNTIDLGGPIGKDVRAYGNQVLLTSTVAGDFQGAMQSLVLGANTKISGNLTYQSGEEINVPAGTVGGKITYQPPQEAETKMTGVFFGLKFFMAIAGFLLSLFIGLVYLFLFPKRAQGIVETIGSQPWPSLGLGLLTIILFPLILIILAVSLIGIPFLFILIPVFLFFLYMAKIFTAFYLGRRILNNSRLLGPLALGLLLYYVLGLIPVIGFLTAFAFVTVGLGAFLLDLKSLRQPAR